MKVYTHYYPINGREGFRWRTLLQFGESWDIIGSIVMKNPGSANFMFSDKRNLTDLTLLKELRKFDNADSVNDDWFEFKADNTMKAIAKMFSIRYESLGVPLSGVIQIFNLFYIRESDFSKALTKSGIFKTPQKMAQYDIENLVLPVYLGFSRTLAHHKIYGEIAKRFFEKAQELGTHYLNDDFDENDFFHPLYLMAYGKNDPKCVSTLERFVRYN